MAGIIKDAAGNAVIIGDTIIENPTLYVDDTNGNDSNSGATAGAGNALKTIQAAVNKLGNTIRGIATINVAAGDYFEMLTVEGISGSELRITGAGEGSTTISGANSGSPSTSVRNQCMLVQNNAIGRIVITGFTMKQAVKNGIALKFNSGNSEINACTFTAINKFISPNGVEGNGAVSAWFNGGVTFIVDTTIVDVLGIGFAIDGCQMDFFTTGSTVTNVGTPSEAYTGMCLYVNRGAQVNVLCTGCSFSARAGTDMYAVLLNQGYFYHQEALTLANAAVGVRARWESFFTGTGTVTETSVTTSSDLTTGAVRTNGS